MEKRFTDPEKQELYEKLFNTYWNHFKDNYEEYCEKFEKIKLQNIQALQSEETILGKFFSSNSFKFVDDGLSYENIDISKLNENLSLYRVDDIPIMKGINRESVKKYFQKKKQTFQNTKDQELYESLYKLYCKKLLVKPKPNSACSNAIYYRCYERISKRDKYFNKYSTVKSDRYYLQSILKELGCESFKKTDNTSKYFPIFDINYPFWSIPDCLLRIASWFGLIYLIDVIFGLKASIWIFLSFIISQLILLGIISLLFKTNKLNKN